MSLRTIQVQTQIDEKFKFMARDLDGSLFVFENKPSIATDIACDTWDVKTGELLQVTPKIGFGVGDELGDWRESLMELV
jgi:hypothetical protein